MLVKLDKQITIIFLVPVLLILLLLLLQSEKRTRILCLFVENVVLNDVR